MISVCPQKQPLRQHNAVNLASASARRPSQAAYWRSTRASQDFQSQPSASPPLSCYIASGRRYPAYIEQALEATSGHSSWQTPLETATFKKAHCGSRYPNRHADSPVLIRNGRGGWRFSKFRDHYERQARLLGSMPPRLRALGPDQTASADYFEPSRMGSVSISLSDLTMVCVSALYFRKWAVRRCDSYAAWLL